MKLVGGGTVIILVLLLAGFLPQPRLTPNSKNHSHQVSLHSQKPGTFEIRLTPRTEVAARDEATTADLHGELVLQL